MSFGLSLFPGETVYQRSGATLGSRIRSTRFDFLSCVRASFFAPVFRDFWELGIATGDENFGEFGLKMT